MNGTSDGAMLVGRLLLAAIFVWSGIGKIAGYSGTVEYMAANGVPGALLPLVIALELVAGIMLIVGFYARWAALALAVFTVLAALLFHLQPDDRTQMIMLAKNFAIVGGLLFVWAAGPGRFSVNAR